MTLPEAELQRRARAGYERSAVYRDWTDSAGRPMASWSALSEADREEWRQIALAVLEQEGA